MNETIIVEQFFSMRSNASFVVEKVLTATDGSAKVAIDVYPNGKFQADKNYVSIFTTLKSDHKYCATVSVKYSILTHDNALRNERSAHYHWQKSEVRGFAQFISHQTCSEIDQGILIDGKLIILAEVYCLSVSEERSNQSTISAAENIIEIEFAWTICGRSDIPNMSNMKLVSTLFPSNKNLTQFYLETEPFSEAGMYEGYMSVSSCIADTYATGPAQLVNNSYMFQSIYETFYTQSSSHNFFIHKTIDTSFFYNAPTSRCLSAFLDASMIQLDCFTLKYHGCYILST